MRGKRWTKDEEEFLLKSYRNMTFREIASKLNRPINSIACKIHHLKNGNQVEFGEDELYFPVYDRRELNRKREKLHLSMYDLAGFSGFRYDTVRRTLNTDSGSNSAKMLLGIILDDMEEKLR